MSKEDDRSLHQIKDVLILGRKHTYRLRHQGSHAKCLCLRKETLWVGFRAQREIPYQLFEEIQVGGFHVIPPIGIYPDAHAFIILVLCQFSSYNSC